MNNKASLDLFLTEISFELLGNTMYDINGQQQTSLTGCFKPIDADKMESEAKKCDLLKDLQIPSSLNELTEDSCKAILDHQFNNMINNEKMDCDVKRIKQLIKNITGNKLKFYEKTIDLTIKKGSGKQFHFENLYSDLLNK